MRLRELGEVVLILAAGVVGWFWFQEHNDRARAEGQRDLLVEASFQAHQRALESDDGARVAAATADSLSAALGLLNARATALSDSLATAVAGTLVTVDVTTGELDALLAEIREHLPEAAHALVDSVEARADLLAASARTAAQAFADERASFAAFRVETDRTVAGQDAAIAAAQLSAQDWQATAAAMELRAVNAERLATRGVWSRIKGSLPLFSLEGSIATVVGIGIGVAATH